MRNVTKQLLLVCTALTALAFASCEVIASTAGQDLNSETVWIRLTPSVPTVDGNGKRTATLTFDFNRAIDGLTNETSVADLDAIFTFEFNPPAENFKITGVEKFAEAIYWLTVVNVPLSGIATVTVNRPGITPPSRLWSMDGRVIEDKTPEQAPEITDFVFIQSENTSLTEPEAVGSIDQTAGEIVVVVPEGASLNNLIPTVSVSDGSDFSPKGAQDFTGTITYTVTSSATGLFKDYEVRVIEQKSDSASIEMFQFKAEDNAQNLAETVTAIITGSSIALTVPYGTALGALVPSIQYVGGMISPANLAAQNFSSPVEWTVTALDETTTAVYWVTVSVAEPVYGIALSGGGSDPLSGNYSFGEAVTGYSPQPPALTVSVSNTGNAETGALDVAITGTSFDLSSATISSISAAAGSNSATFTVQPKSGLGPAVGAPNQSYSATITVSGGNISVEKTFAVSFTVKNWASAPSIALTLGYSGELGYTITPSNPAADSYDIYYIAANESDAATIKSGGTKITGASTTGTIASLANDTLYSVIVTARKADYTDLDSAIVQATPCVPQPVYRYVKQGGSGDGSGASWANASGNIQAMIDAVAANVIGGEVWVAAGAYVPGDSQDDSFTLKDKVKVYGGFPADITDSTARATAMSERNAKFHTDGIVKNLLDQSILSGDIDHDSDPDVYGPDSLTGGYSGNAKIVVVCNADGFPSDFHGVIGGLLDGFLVTGGYDAGISNLGTYDTPVSLSLRNLTIKGNNGYGINNDEYVSSILTNSTIAGNNGIGMRSGWDSESTLINVVVAGNDGHGISMYSSSITLINVLIAGNNGIGILNDYNGGIGLTNVTIAGNKSYGIEHIRAGGQCQNCIIWGNAGGSINLIDQAQNSSITVNDSLVQADSWANNCTQNNSLLSNDDPFVADGWIDPSGESWTRTTAGKYQLNSSSAAIDAGNDTSYDSQTAPSGWAATGLSWTDILAKDLDGAARKESDHIDMGAYETANNDV